MLGGTRVIFCDYCSARRIIAIHGGSLRILPQYSPLDGSLQRRSAGNMELAHRISCKIPAGSR